MKIGYFTTRFPYKNPHTGEVIRHTDDGGVENVAYDLAVEMVKRGHEVLVFTSSIDSRNSIEDYGEIKIYRYGMNFMVGQTPISLKLLYKPFTSNFNLDIIHAHLGNLPSPLTAYFCSKIRKKPFIVTYHGDWIGGFGDIKRRMGVFLFNNYFCDLILSRADMIIALSENHIMQSHYLKKYGDKIEVVPNGINLKNFDAPISKNECRAKLNLPINRKIILFVGSLTPRKAPDVLLKSVPKVLKEFPDSYFIFVGDGNYKNELNELSKKLNVWRHVIFTGYIDDSIKLLYYKSADIFVLPSLSEAFPLTLLEAAASGLPLIGSELECFKVIINEGYNGLLAKTSDEIDLANKIVYLLKNEDVIRDMGRYSMEKVKEFSWEKIADKTENIYLNFI